MVWDTGGRGKVVWLPTFDAEYYLTRDGSSEPFVSVVVDGRPAPELEEIFTLVAEHDLVLATGHSAPEEVLLLLPEMRRLGVRNILITHVFGQNPVMEQMRSMADAGAVMEIDWLAVYGGGRTIDEYVEAINAIGAEQLPDVLGPRPGEQPAARRGFACLHPGISRGGNIGRRHRHDDWRQPGAAAGPSRIAAAASGTMAEADIAAAGAR